MSRSLEIRRHSYTKKAGERGSGSHLSADGIRLARQIGETMGAFTRVIASDVPRTLETAIAMGFAVDEATPFPQEVSWESVINEIGWHALWKTEKPFAHVSHMLSSRPNTAQMGGHYARVWLETAMAVPDGESALVVSHGHLMEVALVCCLPDADHASWGPPFAHCEGARLSVNDGVFGGVEFCRLQGPLGSAD